jgi:hypothetical protein
MGRSRDEEWWRDRAPVKRESRDEVRLDRYDCSCLLDDARDRVCNFTYELQLPLRSFTDME